MWSGTYAHKYRVYAQVLLSIFEFIIVSPPQIRLKHLILIVFIVQTPIMKKVTNSTSITEYTYIE